MLDVSTSNFFIPAEPTHSVEFRPEQQAYGMIDFMKKLSPEGRAYYADTVSCRMHTHSSCGIDYVKDWKEGARRI